MVVPSRRRTLLISNLCYAFPDWSKEKIQTSAKESAARMIEMGLFLLLSLLGKEVKRKTIHMSNDVERKQ